MSKFTVKITQLYVCPVCKKEYKRKGFYLQNHLKKCGAIAWIPKIKTEIIFKRIHENLLTQALEKLISGNNESVDSWKINRKPTVQITDNYKKGTKEDYKIVMKELKQKLQTLYI